MVWHVYELSPIDLGWENLKTVEETAADIGEIEARMKVGAQVVDDVCPTIDQFARAWKDAQQEAKNAGWDEDFRHDPVVFWLPMSEHEFRFGFVLKQDSNGTTYVVSPVSLPHLRG